MDVFLNLHDKMRTLDDNTTEEYKSTTKTFEIIDRVFFEYSGCNFQVKSYCQLSSSPDDENINLSKLTMHILDLCHVHTTSTNREIHIHII